MVLTGLRWWNEDLGAQNGIYPRKPKPIERVETILSATISTMIKIIKSRATTGIAFMGTAEDRPGLRMRATQA